MAEKNDMEQVSDQEPVAEHEHEETSSKKEIPFDDPEEGTAEESDAATEAEEEEAPQVALDPVEALKAQVQAANDKYLRLFAEFDNFKKRNAKERIELIGTATESLMTDLLPVMDDFDRGLKQIEEGGDLESLKQGIQLIYNKLKGTLEQKGLKAMDTIEDEFNPEFHEAITEIPAPNKKMKGKIVDEIEKGYYLHEKIIRYPKVVVGK